MPASCTIEAVGAECVVIEIFTEKMQVTVMMTELADSTTPLPWMVLHRINYIFVANYRVRDRRQTTRKQEMFVLDASDHLTLDGRSVFRSMNTGLVVSFGE
jgi:hypothetical protein